MTRTNKLISLVFALLAFVYMPLAANAMTIERLGTRNIYTTGFTVVPAAACTDVFTIYGSSTCKIYIQSISITGTQTTAGKVLVNLVKRSTADTTGTPVAQTAVPFSSKMVASTATGLNSYTANPGALGTSVGVMDSQYVFIPAAATAAPGDNAILFLETQYGSPIVLNSATEGLAINLNGATVTGGSLSITMQWEEVQN